MAAARRLREGRSLPGDLWCVLSAYHYEGLAHLPVADRDELLLLAVLDPRLQRLLDDAGRAQVDELLRGAGGTEIQCACNQSSYS